MRFAGIRQPEELRTVTRAHLIAWRDELRRRELGGATIRHRLASLFEYLCEKNAVTHNPVKGVERPQTEGGEGKTPAIIRRATCSQRPTRTPSRASATAPSCHRPVDAAVPRAAARGAVQAEGQGFPATRAKVSRT